MLHRLTDLYGISFKQKYMERIKQRGTQDKQQNPETYKKISELPYIKHYSPAKYFGKVSAEQFMENIAKKYPELEFIPNIFKQQVKDWNLLTTLPISLISNADNIASEISEILDTYKQQSKEFSINTATPKLQSYSQYVPHVYRTLKISDNLKSSSKNVIDTLEKKNKNVPDIMIEPELREFIQLLDM